LALWWTQEWAWTTTGDFQHLARVKRIASGVLFPTLPNGGWSITVEFHFYLLLPLLLAAVWGTPSSWAALLVAVAAFRAILWLVNGEVQFLAYWTIFGRLDQFLLGMLAWRYSERLRGQHLPAAIAVAVLFAFFTWFTKTGGLLEKAPGLASSSHPIWIIGPMLEGLCYATLIAYYDQTAKPRPTGLSAFVGRIGEYSYSIYLLHFFVVFGAATLVNEHITPMTNYYVGLAWSVVWFLALVPVAYLSYRFIESPFLRLRRPYLKTRTTSQTVSPLWTATK
jgi:peptidoglycan/LPS O-acetylase OafA/YrhL